MMKMIRTATSAPMIQRPRWLGATPDGDKASCVVLMSTPETQAREPRRRRAREAILRFERIQNVPGRTFRGPLLQSRVFRSYAALVSVATRIHGAEQPVYRNDERSAACLRTPGGRDDGQVQDGTDTGSGRRALAPPCREAVNQTLPNRSKRNMS